MASWPNNSSCHWAPSRPGSGGASSSCAAAWPDSPERRTSMKLVDHPELADRLAAAYGLGTLRGGARRRFEAQARKSPALRAAALAWQERFAGMTELQPGEAPSANVWKRIEIELAQHRPSGAGAQAPARDWRRALRR